MSMDHRSNAPRRSTSIIAGLAACVCMSLVPVSAQPTPVQKASTSTNQADVVYGSYSGLALLLDVRRPAKPNGFAILHIPGSGFQAPLTMEPYHIKDLRWTAAMEEPFLDAGFTVFTINHRAAPRFKYPAPMEDAALAARFIRARAGDYGVTADWLGVMGESSGGTLALTLATRGDVFEPGKTGQVPDCVIAQMPASDMLKVGQHDMAAPLVTNFIDVTPPYPEESEAPGYAERVKRFIDASPLNHVNRSMSRLLLIHGDADRLIPIEQSQLMYDKVRSGGGSVDMIVMPGVGHRYPAPYPAQAAQWMTQCLKQTMPKG